MAPFGLSQARARRAMWPAWALAFLAAHLALPTRAAWAHLTTRNVNVTGVVAAPHDEMTLGGLTFGAMVRPHPSGPYFWICPQVLFGPTSYDPWLIAIDKQRLVYADPDEGVAISADAGCSWHAVADKVRPFRLAGLAQHAQRPERLYLVGNAQAQSEGHLFVSDDAGAHWRPTPAHEPGLYLTAVAHGPAAPGRLYLLGTNNRAHNSGRLLVSDDDGQHWQTRPLPQAPAQTGKGWLALHPTDANVLLVGVLDVASNGTQVLRSVDQGQRFERVLLVREPLRAMAFDAAFPQRAVVAGTHRTFVSGDGGASFVRLLAPSKNACLAPSRQLCADALSDGFALGEFAADGTLAPRFLLSELAGPYHCSAQSPLATQCLPLWPSVAQRLGARVPPPRGVVPPAP